MVAKIAVLRGLTLMTSDYFSILLTVVSVDIWMRFTIVAARTADLWYPTGTAIELD